MLVVICMAVVAFAWSTYDAILSENAFQLLLSGPTMIVAGLGLTCLSVSSRLSARPAWAAGTDVCALLVCCSCTYAGAAAHVACGGFGAGLMLITGALHSLAGASRFSRHKC